MVSWCLKEGPTPHTSPIFKEFVRILPYGVMKSLMS